MRLKLKQKIKKDKKSPKLSKYKLEHNRIINNL